MNKYTRIALNGLLIAFAIILGLSGCGIGEPTGELMVVIQNNVRSRNIAPAITMEIDHYQLVVELDSTSEVVYDNIVSGSTLIEGLQPSIYNITVTGLNADPTAIAIGTDQVTIEVGVGATADVTVQEFTGDGFTDFTARWQPDILYDVIVDSALTSATTDVTTDISGDWDVFTDSAGINPRPGDTTSSTVTGWLGEADWDATLAAGFYVLELRLFDGAILSTGIVELVRIVQDQTTVDGGALDLTANAASGELQVNITPSIWEDLELTTDLPEGDQDLYDGDPNPVITMATADSSTATWEIYENGVSKHVAVSDEVVYEFDASQYAADSAVNLSAIAINADGTKAGDLQWSFDLHSEAVSILAEWEVSAAQASGGSGTRISLYWRTPGDPTFEEKITIFPFEYAGTPSAPDVKLDAPMVAGETIGVRTPTLPAGDYEVAMGDNQDYVFEQFGAPVGVPQQAADGTDFTVPGPGASLIADFGLIEGSQN